MTDIHDALKPRPITEGGLRMPSLDEVKTSVTEYAEIHANEWRRSLHASINQAFADYTSEIGRSHKKRKRFDEKGPHLRVNCPVGIDSVVIDAAKELIKGTEWHARLKDGMLHFTVKGTPNAMSVTRYDSDFEYEEVMEDEDGPGIAVDENEEDKDVEEPATKKQKQTDDN